MRMDALSAPIRRAFLALVLVGSLGVQGWTQDQTYVIPGTVIDPAPTIDGELSPGEWDGVPGGSGFVDGDTGNPAPVGVQFWIGYDSEFVYVAAKIKTDPSRVRADEYRDNVSLEGNDIFSFGVDPFGNGSSFNNFSVNPRGATSFSISGGRAPKVEWVGEIRGAGKIVDDGWQVEVRVPWKIMPLPSTGTRDLRFYASTTLRTTQRDYTWRRTNGDNALTPIWSAVEIPLVPVRRELLFLPFAYGGWDRAEDLIANAGLDFKSQIGDRLTLVGTLNPDFRNIENEVLSLDFSRFERLAGESRPFFAEGGSYRRTGGLFASQRIREFDLGVSAYGNLDDDTQFSLLNTQDFGRQSAVVAAVRNQATLATTVDAAYVGSFEKGRENQGFYTRINPEWGGGEFSASLAMTDDQIEGSGSEFNAEYEAYGSGKYFYINVAEATSNYLPRIGFRPERDYRRVGVYRNENYTVESGSVMEYGFGFGASYSSRINGDFYRREANVNTSLTFRNGLDIDLGASWEQFEQFGDYIYSASVEIPRGDPYRRVALNYALGRLDDEQYQNAGLSVSYRPLARLQTNARYQWVNHFEAREQGIASFNYEIGELDSFGGRAVYRDGKWNAYLSYRRSGGRGIEYYVILGDPNADTFQSSVVFKVVMPLSIGY